MLKYRRQRKDHTSSKAICQEAAKPIAQNNPSQKDPPHPNKTKAAGESLGLGVKTKESRVT